MAFARSIRLLPVLVLALLVHCGGGSGSLGGDAPANGTPVDYVPGTTITANSSQNIVIGPNSARGQSYYLNVSQQTNLEFILTPTFPAYIGLFIRASQYDLLSSPLPIVENNTNTRFKAFLPAGSYEIFVSSLTGAQGAYTLATKPTALSGCTSGPGGTVTPADLGIARIRTFVSGTVTHGDCGGSLSRTHVYAFRGAASVTVTFTVDRVAGVAIRTQGGSILASHEFTGAGTWTTTVNASQLSYFGAHVESRAIGTADNLPLNYSVSIQ